MEHYIPNYTRKKNSSELKELLSAISLFILKLLFKHGEYVIPDSLGPTGCNRKLGRSSWINFHVDIKFNLVNYILYV